MDQHSTCPHHAIWRNVQQLHLSTKSGINFCRLFDCRRQRIRMQWMRWRLLRKLQKYKQKEKNKKKIEDSECSPDERLNCFSHNIFTNTKQQNAGGTFVLHTCLYICTEATFHNYFSKKIVYLINCVILLKLSAISFYFILLSNLYFVLFKYLLSTKVYYFMLRLSLCVDSHIFGILEFRPLLYLKV